MLGPLALRKILNDLWLNKTRTVLIVLTIALGVFAVGTISRSAEILSRDLAQSYASANPASAKLVTDRTFNNDLVEAVRKLPGVQEAEARHTLSVQVKVGPDEWHSLSLMTRADYTDLRVNKVHPEEGLWPPPRGSILLERSSVSFLPSNSQTLLIELPNRKQREVLLGGLVHDLTRFPSNFSSVLYGYINPKTLQDLDGTRGYNELQLRIASTDRAEVLRVVEQVTEKMVASGLVVTNRQIFDPSKPPLNDIIQALLFLLGALALLSLMLSAFLVINTITALLAREVRQIGMMKAIGASRSHVMSIYVGMVFIVGLLAWVLSVPFASLASRGLTLLLTTLLNFDIISFDVPRRVYLLDIATSLLVPLLVGFIPLLNGTRVSVKEAVSYTGGENKFGSSWIDDLLNRIRFLPVTLLYALRNIFRHKQRLALTLLTLSLASAIFISIVSVRASLLLTLEDVAAYWQQDIKIFFTRPYRFNKLEPAALSVPGVIQVEPRLLKKALRLYPDGSAGQQNITVFGVPPTSPFIEPTVIEGRWLLPEDKNAIVLNIEILQEETDIAVGDHITLEIEQRELNWQVVGIITGQIVGGGRLMAPIAYTNYSYLGQATRSVGEISQILIETERHETLFQTDVSRTLVKHFRDLGLQTGLTQLNSEVRATLENVFGILLTLIFIMGILLAIVGGLGLMTMMSLSVLERTRELAVLRAIGGTSQIVTQIVIIEGLFIGLLSWLFGALLALPLSKLLSDNLGLIFLKVPLTYHFPISGVLIWLMIMMILSALASFLPARSASQVSVNQALSYE